MRLPHDTDSLFVRGLPLALGVYVVAAGVVSAAGWPLDWPALADWDGDGIATQPNAAAAAALAGLGLAALAAGWRRVAAVLGVAVATLAGLTLVEHLTGLDAGIDRWLLFDRTWGRTGTRAPGRMGPPATVCWLMIGLALAAGSTTGRLRRAMPALGLVVAALAGLSLIGYLFGAGNLYTLPTVTVIALQTSSFLFASGVGLVAAARDMEPMRTLLADSGAGLLARRALPLALTLPVVIAYLVSLRQRAGYFDGAMATALIVVLLVVLTCAAVWWGVVAVRHREQDLTIATARLTEAHASVQHSEARMNAFLQQLPMGVGMFEADGRWVYANPMLDRFVRTDRAASDAGEIARWRLVDAGGDPVPRDQWPGALALRGETVTGVECLHTLGDGTGIWTRITAAPFRDADGAIRGAVAIVQDIDEQKRAVEAVARAGRQLRLVTDHVPVLIAQCDRDGRYKFVNRAYAERFGLRPEDVVGRHLRDVLGEAAYASLHDRVTETLAGHAVEFEIEIPYRTGAQFMHVAYAPERDEGGVVVGLVAAIVNITARKRAEVDGADLVIRVTDNGIGLAPETLSTVFEMFAQADASIERARGGLGIGLGLARQLVEMHGGTLTAASDGLGRGSEFVIRLPDVVRDAPPARVRRPAPSAGGLRHLRRVLVVDDNLDAAHGLRLALELHGLEVVVAHDGRQALVEAAVHTPDAVLLDIGLPGMNGYDVCRELRRQPWGARAVILAMTGWGQQEDRRRSSEAGFDAHLVKPVEHETLLDALATTVRPPIVPDPPAPGDRPH